MSVGIDAISVHLSKANSVTNFLLAERETGYFVPLCINEKGLLMDSFFCFTLKLETLLGIYPSSVG